MQMSLIKVELLSSNLARWSQTDLLYSDFIFNLKKHELMQKFSRENVNLNHAKKLPKQMNQVKLQLNTPVEMIKGTAEIERLWHKQHKVATSKDKYKGHKQKQYYMDSPQKKHQSSAPTSQCKGYLCPRCGSSKHQPGFQCPEIQISTL